MPGKKTVTRVYILDYVPKNIDYLRSGTMCPCDVFVKDNSVSYNVAFSKGESITHASKENLKKQGVTKIFVKDDDVEKINKYHREHEDADKSSVSIEEKIQKFSTERENLFIIDKNVLKAGKPVHFSIYMLKGLELIELLSASERTPVAVDASTIGIINKYHPDIAIMSGDIPLYTSYLKNLDSSGDNSCLIIRENLKALFDSLVRNITSKDLFISIADEIHPLVNMAQQNINNILPLLIKDNETYCNNIHSVNVAVLSVTLGVATGLEDRNLSDLAVGAFLHDIGKYCVPSAILNKTGNLSYAEFQVLKGHVLAGEQILRRHAVHAGISSNSVVVVLQHHEKISGRGYPYGLSGKAINMSSQIVGIANDFDLLTTRKIYKKPLSVLEAMQLLVSEPQHYDYELLKQFVKVIAARKDNG